MATSTSEYDVAINGNKGYVGIAYRRDRAQAKAIFGDVLGRRNTADVITFLCDGVAIETKNGERKPSARGK